MSTLTLRSSAISYASDTTMASAESAMDEMTIREAPVSSDFGELAMTWLQLMARLDETTGAAFSALVNDNQALGKAEANAVAAVVQEWALSHGVTHYAHWFFPLTGTPAEKHDSFLAFEYTTGEDPSPFEGFSGSVLLQGEPDASSFPNGGLRITAEARGYTMWDPTSPMFIRSEGATRTLCLPTAYIGWRGEALDYKTPLLRARKVVSDATVRMCKLLGDTEIKAGIATLGAEQEYFVVDKAFLGSRPDLLMAGRTLFGRVPQRNQQLEDHYFGAIPARVQTYITEVEDELYKLGVPIKTRHCEVAPAQFETAPIFEEMNVAVDHNTLSMDVMKRVADRHGLTCLMHEKPFAGINGSGKHNNWALATDGGENLLDPGDNPVKDVRFLTFLATVMHAVYNHAVAIRATVASAGNDHRLGANEAPPSIISIYMGDALTRVIESVLGDGKEVDLTKTLEQVVNGIYVKKDTGDRNRTSPFAFTGNKFEYRAVGSNENSAWPQAVLNAAIADSLNAIADRIEAKGGDVNTAAMAVVKEVFAETKIVCFDGNGYSDDWVKEAKKRGLPNLKNTPEAVAAFAEEANHAFLVRTGVLTEPEIHARAEIILERYCKWIEIEATSMLEISRTMIVPGIEADLMTAAKTAKITKEAVGEHKATGRRVKQIASGIESILDLSDSLETALEKVLTTEGVEQAHAMADSVLPAMNALRDAVDAAEGYASDANWALPKYREMLFLGV
jgi:glutamine synthetase